MILLQLQGRPAAAVRDTIAAVFRQHDYDRSVRASLIARALDWIWQRLHELFGALDEAPALGWSLRVLAVLFVLSFVARLAWVAWLRRTRGAELAGEGGRARAARDGDSWRHAQAFAAAGDYTAAAHALYAGLLEVIARRERIRLHPSKTVGDYARELRQRSSAIFGRYREFARTYEVVIYGEQACDRARWERLHALASDIAGPRG